MVSLDSGVKHQNFEDGMTIMEIQIHFNQKNQFFIESHGDHRIAMSFLIAGLKCSQSITVKDCKNIFTSFPNFIELISSIGYRLENNNIIIIDGPSASCMDRWQKH